MNTLTLNNKKGLTLIELLGVIVILGIIAAIAFPVIGNVVRNSRQSAFEANVESFIDAALTDAQSRNLQNGDKKFVYSISQVDKNSTATFDLKVGTPETPVVGGPDLGFTRSLNIGKGSVTIIFNENGGIDSIVISDTFGDFQHGLSYTSAEYKAKN